MTKPRLDLLESLVAAAADGKKTQRSLALLRALDAADATWHMHVPPAFNSALDIRLTPRVASADGFSWTQGVNFSFSAGDVIYDSEAAGLPWDAGNVTRAFAVESAQPACLDAAAGTFFPGRVCYREYRPAGNRLAAVAVHQVTQVEFVRLLMAGPA